MLGREGIELLADQGKQPIRDQLGDRATVRTPRVGQRARGGGNFVCLLAQGWGRLDLPCSVEGARMGVWPSDRRGFLGSRRCQSSLGFSFERCGRHVALQPSLLVRFVEQTTFREGFLKGGGQGAGGFRRTLDQRFARPEQGRGFRIAPGQKDADELPGLTQAGRRPRLNLGRRRHHLGVNDLPLGLDDLQVQRPPGLR